MTDFSDLPIKDGVGDYDLNRFRVAFRSDYGARYLGALLVGSFPGYFNGPAGTVERDGDRLKFHGNLKVRGHYVPTPHPDWVRTILKDPERGFVVQTLHRDSWAADDVTAGAGGGLGGLIGAAEAARVNRYHFLAGRRGWRVDDAGVFNFPNPTNDIIVVETAAIERFSLTELLPIKDMMQPLIVEIWCHLLTKFTNMPHVRRLSASEWPIEPGWKSDGTVHYTMQHYSDAAKMRSSPDYREVWNIYPQIYDEPR